MKLQNLDKVTSQIAILGFGKEGKSALNFLKKIGFKNITILDANEKIELPPETRSKLGDNYLENLDMYDLIIKSPGVSPYQEKLIGYKEKFYSLTQIFFEFYTGKVIGITGTKGKSTISQLIYSCLKNAGYNVKIVGNIGLPVLEEIDILSRQSFDYIIYELSSYMLEGFKPNLHLGYINNIFPCHLDWHINMGIYTQAKMNILKNAKHKIHHYTLAYGGESFGNGDSFHVKNQDIYYLNEVFIKNVTTKLYGTHNLENICGVAKILSKILPKHEKIKNILTKTLKDFSPLPHRLEKIGIFKEIEFIDDGAAVTPEATIAAIKSTSSNIETLLIGGKDADADMSKLEKEILGSMIQNIVLFPESGYKLFQSYTYDILEEDITQKKIFGKNIRFLKTKSMESAVRFSYSYTKKGKCVLLSSGAQSYSLWKNFEEKGKEYKKYIEKYAEI